MRHLLFAGLAASAALFAAGPAEAVLEHRQCTADEARQAIATENMTFVHFHANWCPICRAQKTILQEISETDITGVTGVICEVNFDTERSFKADMGISRQSSIIRFEFGEETGRYLYRADPQEMVNFVQGF